MSNKNRLRIILWSMAILFALTVAWWEMRKLPEPEQVGQDMIFDESLPAPEPDESRYEPEVQDDDPADSPLERPALLVPDFVAEQVRSGETVGRLIIPSINFSMPVIADATASNLNRSPAMMKSTHLPGSPGNSVISGHRMYEFGSHLNRIDEIEVGDPIFFHGNGKELLFQVEQITVVDPAEIWILMGDQRESRITLFACTPIRIATHRLVVFAVLKETKVIE